MRFLHLLVATSVLACSLAAQSLSNAWVRVVHLSPDAPAVNVRANGDLAFENVPYKGFTAYTPVPAGQVMFGLEVASSGANVLSSSFALQGGNYYTFYAMGRVSGGNNPLQLRGTGDQVEPRSGSVLFRVVHGAPSAPAVDVYATTPYTPLASSTPLLQNVPFGAASDYFVVPPGLYQARVAVAGTRNVAISSMPLPLQGSIVRTIIAIDPAGENMPFDFLILPDADGR
jgi:hypothetical protein